MKNHILTLLFFTTTFLSAQEEKPLPLVEKKQWKINFLYPGVSYEYGLGKKTTLYSSLYLIPAYVDAKQINAWTIVPIIQEEFRYYYNLEKQVQKNRRIAGNTGPYISLLALYGLPPLGKYKGYTKIDGLTIAPTWGVQYTFKNGFNMNVSFSLGYNFSPYESTRGFKFINNVSIGWVIR